MFICLKVKTLDSQTYDFTVDNEISVRQFKETIAEKTQISADLQRIIYCGRVLVDEKQLKDYDVDGKVVHVVERPPPSSRPASGASANSRRQRDDFDVNVRHSPIYRALDGMVVGAMTIPMNAAAGGQTNPTPGNHSLNPSSSFCMNRITVARHMLECANNIALYLENPDRGLNNSSLDILTQGRWTMESTVFEVGISAAVEIPQNQTQNLVGALRGAVSAALQNSHPNVTVVQLPTVFGSNDAAGGVLAAPSPSVQATEDQPSNENVSIDVEMASAPAAADAAPESISTEAPPTEIPPPPPEQQNAEASAGNNSNTNNPSQRTNTTILGEVVQQMRQVQVRMEPFVQQYYDILMNDPVFAENDANGRENSQRIFDRVSEALHYMSHAQHAISDLTLDLSQNAPRHLCCRPILVEQGVRSNNYLASFLQPQAYEFSITNNTAGSPASNTTSRPPIAPSMQTAAASTAESTTTSASAQTTNSQATNSNTTSIGSGNAAGPGQSPIDANADPRAIRNIFSPIFLRNRLLSTNVTTNSTPESLHSFSPQSAFVPMTTRSAAPSSANSISDAANQERTAEIVLNFEPRRTLVPNPQLQVARIIQAVVNSAPIDSDVHVQINAPPNLLGFGVPISGNAGPQQPSTPPTQNPAATQNNGNNMTTNTTESNPESNQARVTTATHPTTSTQTRSTARPQVHIANFPSWNARVIPANMLSSFDRFLPCSSHHIHDNETDANQNNGTNTAARTRNPARQRRQPQEAAQVNATNANTNANANAQRATPPNQSAPSTRSETSGGILNFTNDDFNIPFNFFGSNFTLRDLVDVPNPNTLNRIRSELQAFVTNSLFSGSPITDENMNNAINQVIQLLSSVLIFLQQYDLPDYDTRASIENFIRNRLPLIINLIHEDNSLEFGTRLLRELYTFIRRFFVILVTCVGRSNAERYLNQIFQLTITSNNVREQEVMRTLQQHLMTLVNIELDRARQNVSEVQEFLVIRRPPAVNHNSNITQPMETDDGAQQPDGGTEQRTETQSTSQVNAENNIQSNKREQHAIPPKPVKSTEPLPTVVPGSETWHGNFPTDWLPIITRDIEKQRRQSPQPPFSDAYLAGTSAKRRKIIQSSKSPTDVPSLLSEGVRRAIQSTGMTPAGPTVDEVSSTIAADPAAQNSYREALRSNLDERLRTDPDFNPEKFPNSSKCFKK